MEFIRFIFSSFWIWAGFVLIIALTGDVVVKIVAAIKKPTLKDARYVTIDADIEELIKGGDIQ